MRPVPAVLCSGPFTSGEARHAGVTASMLRGRRYRKLLHDVYVVAETPWTYELACVAALKIAPEAVLSHASAALALGLPSAVGEPEPRRVHVTTPVPLAVPQIVGLVVHAHQLPLEHVASTPWGPATTAARTFVDRSREIDLEDLVAVGDRAIRRGLASTEELEAVVDWAGGRRGVVRARRALRLIDPAAANAMETRLRLVLVLDGLPAPECNADVHDEHGEWVARVDLLYRQYWLVIEFDGRVHLENRQRVADLRRRNLLTAAGYTVLHFTADDVLRRRHLVADQVHQALAAAGFPRRAAS